MSKTNITNQTNQPVKVVFVGDESSGKSLLLNALSGATGLWTAPTVGTDFQKIIISAEKNEQIYNVWDTSGNVKYLSLLPMYCRDADVVYVCINLKMDRSNVISTATNWVNQLNSYGVQNEHIVLVGTQGDRVYDGTFDVKKEALITFARELGLCKEVYCKSAGSIISRKEIFEKEQNFFFSMIPCEKKNLEAASQQEATDLNYKATMKAELLGMSHAIDSTAFSPAKNRILKTVTDQIDHIHAAMGWTIKIAPKKANVLIELYKSLYEELRDERLYKIIEKWMSIEDRANMEMIAIERRTVLFFHASTKSELMISKILKLAHPLYLAKKKQQVRTVDETVDDANGCLLDQEMVTISPL